MFKYECVRDCFKKNPRRTWEYLMALLVFYALYFCHTFLPSYETSRVVTVLNLNLVLANVTLDLMLNNMSAKPFMAYHPAFLLLAAPLIAYFGVGVSAKVEFAISIAVTVIAAALFAYRQAIVAIQFYDFSQKSFLYNK